MIDIIIPAYNCSKTLPRTLASIAAQTRPEKCIVTVIDDCSTENLEPIVRTFQKLSKIRTQYIKLDKNLGSPGLVRQVGIDNTIAPFITFIDSDDIFAPHAVQYLNSILLTTGADFCFGHFYSEKKNGEIREMNSTCTTWLHGNVYKRSFLLKNNIRFCEGYNEDGAFNTQCMALTKKITVIEEPLYYWMHNGDSLTRTATSFTEKFFHHHIRSLSHAYKNILSKNNYYNLYSFLGAHIGQFFHIYNTILFKLDREETVETVEENKIFQETLLKADEELVSFLKITREVIEKLEKNKDENKKNYNVFKKSFSNNFKDIDIEKAKISIENFFEKFNIPFKDITGIKELIEEIQKEEKEKEKNESSDN